MNSIFKRKKSPEQLVKSVRESFDDHLSNHSAENENELIKRLAQVKNLLYGENSSDSSSEVSTPNVQKCTQMAQLLTVNHLLKKLIFSLESLPFEARKHVAQIYNNLMRRDLDQFVQYITQQQSDLIFFLIAAYEKPDIALNCGSMLRESLRHEAIVLLILNSSRSTSSNNQAFWAFFEKYVHYPNFDVGSDAFASLKDILTRHKAISAKYFEDHFDVVFEKYNLLLASDNYVTRRQSLKLLGEILLDRANFNIMMRYIGKKNNLKMMMNLLRDKSNNIQFEAFHVFKVFVANPKKSEDITQILYTNKAKLIAYLQNFQNDKEDDQFGDEKALLIKTLENIEVKNEVESTN